MTYYLSKIIYFRQEYVLDKLKVSKIKEYEH